MARPRTVDRPRIARDRQPAAEAAGKLALGLRFRAFVGSLPDHAWLDRVVRGRAWIPLLGVLLTGIVAAQVEILKLNASMGRALEQNTTLTTQNQLLRANVASLGNDQRIERLAGTMGMVAPPPGAVGFLLAKPGGNVSGALGNLHATNPVSFLSLTPANGAVVTGPGTSTLASTSATNVVVPTPTPGAPATSGTTGSAATGSTAAGSTAAGSTAAGSTGAGSTASGYTGTGTVAPAATGTAAPPAAGTGATTATATGTTTATSSAGAGGPTGSGGAYAGATAGTQQTAGGSGTQGTGAGAASPSVGASTQTPAAQSGSQGSATGAAAIQPAGSGQQGGGG